LLMLEKPQTIKAKQKAISQLAVVSMQDKLPTFSVFLSFFWLPQIQKWSKFVCSESTYFNVC